MKLMRDDSDEDAKRRQRCGTAPRDLKRQNGARTKFDAPLFVVPFYRSTVPPFHRVHTL